MFATLKQKNLINKTKPINNFKLEPKYSIKVDKESNNFEQDFMREPTEQTQ